jgi:ubiquinone/menaquinone biosynthesis C-methylase UbiE
MREKEIQSKLNQSGIERGFSEVEWLNIYFDELDVELSSENLPTNNFYNQFYKKLLEKYNNIESLPKIWIQNKKNTAENILKEINNNQKILSYGCGTGYVEKTLIELNPTLDIFALDFADNARHWIKANFSKITFQNKLYISQKFDLIYLCQVLYALSYSDCIELIKQLSNHLKPNGKILLINSSIIPYENGEREAKHTLKSYIKSIIRPFYKKYFQFLKKNKKKNKEQFWGWQRNNKKYFKMAIEANMNISKSYSAAKQSFIMLSKIKKN